MGVSLVAVGWSDRCIITQNVKVLARKKINLVFVDNKLQSSFSSWLLKQDMRD